MPLAPQNIRYSTMAAGPALHNDLRKCHPLEVGDILADDRTSTLRRVAQAARRGRMRLSLPEYGIQSRMKEARKMARGTQLSIALENKPGQLAKVASALARAKVNIRAITVVDSAEVGVIRLVTSSNARARAALTRAGMNVVQSQVIIASLPNEPGALAGAARKLAAAKINVEYVYGSAARRGEAATIVIGVSNVARAARVKL